MRCASVRLAALSLAAAWVQPSSAWSGAGHARLFVPATHCARFAPIRASDKWKSSASGLKYLEVREGDGEVPRPDSRVAVQYTAKIASGELAGQIYDGTRPPYGNGEPYVFKLGNGRVIKGWEEGVSTMRVGGRRTLAIPNALGYGRLAYVGSKQRVPPGADLEIDIELVGVYGSVDFSWTQRIFTLENAGPFAILLVVGIFQFLAALPPGDLPPWLADLIPKVLGSQYQRY